MTILYEDNTLIVCAKPFGMLSLPKEGGREESMLSALAARGEGTAPYPVHRLDRQTGGVMVFAKTKQAAAELSAAAAGDGLQKVYLAVTEGIPAEEEAQLCDLLYIDRTRDKSFVVTRKRRGVHEARLTYRLLATLPAADGQPPLSLLRVALQTGRTHQIRAQLAARRLPLYGDARYGAKTRGTLGLFAASLSFCHPQSGKEMTFTASPEAFLPFSRFSKDRLCKF